MEVNAEPSVLDRHSRNCSDLQHLVKKIAGLNRVKQFLRNKYQDHWQGPFNLSEQKEAEKTFAIVLQRQAFAETISCLEEQPTNFILKASLRELPDAQAF
jgi:hypothetical protein